MKQAGLRELLKSPVIAILVPLLSILIGVMLKKFNFIEVVLSILILLAIVAIIIVVSKLIDRVHNEDELEITLNRLKELIPLPEFPWLLTASQIDGMERKTNAKDVWIVSPDLSHDTFDGKLTGAVKKNLPKGVTYTYIVPDSDEIKGRLPALERLFKEYPDQLKIKMIPKNVFDLLAVTYVGIEDPLGVNGAPQVFLEIPIERSGYWIKVAEESAIALAGRFRALLESQQNELKRLDDITPNT